MPVALIFALVRVSRFAMASDVIRKAPAIRAASNPSTVCSMSAMRIGGSIAGWAHTHIKRSR